MRSLVHRNLVLRACSVALTVFVLLEVNYPRLTPQTQLAVFAMLGLVLIFLGSDGRRATGSGERPQPIRRLVGAALASLSVLAAGYIVCQNEPSFQSWWLEGQSLGERAGLERPLDIAVGVVGLCLVLEATRRVIGWTLPLLSLVFLLYARFGALLPPWLMPHRGYGLERIVAQTFLHSQGVFGVALDVMFSYVYLFVVFGCLLEGTGATSHIIEVARRWFRNATGSPAKVAVLSSGLLGSLSGSAVANTATTGTFTIPMMKSSGLAPHLAAGLEAAASSGGALMPPVMGAGAYMMLEIIDPPVTYLEVVRAALIPSVLYYLSLFLIVHLQTAGLPRLATPQTSRPVSVWRWEGLVFAAGLTSLVAFLIGGSSVFRAVTLAMLVVLLGSALHRRTRLGPRALVEVLRRSAQSGVALIGAAACVGIILGVVTLTGLGTRLPALILPLAQEHLLLALGALMISSIVLGMGLPSAVCYLLLATMVGPILGKLGVPALAAHLFIFYFGLMSMVTPPVALAAYAASAIAAASFLRSSFAAFRFALVGFVLPFAFVFRPALLMLDHDGGPAAGGRIALALMVSVLGLIPFAAGLAGRFHGQLRPVARVALLIAGLCVMFPGPARLQLLAEINLVNILGLGLAAVLLAARARASSSRQVSGS